MQYNRTRRRQLSRFRNPQAARFTCLINRFGPSVRAFVSPVVRNTSTAGHAGLTRTRSRFVVVDHPQDLGTAEMIDDDTLHDRLLPEMPVRCDRTPGLARHGFI